MYNVGDMIMYGGTGTCRVTEISMRRSAERELAQLYYVLTPLYQNGRIYVPVDTTKVFMRPILSREEALRLIDRIPYIRVEIYHNNVFTQLAGMSQRKTASVTAEKQEIATEDGT
jgi:CarD family transcriptional regulator